MRLATTIGRMGELSKDHRLSARTAPQVTEGFDLAVARMKRGRKFRRKTLTNEGLLGAIVLDYLSREPEEQAEILDRALPCLERLIDNPELGIGDISGDMQEPASFASPDDPPPPPIKKRGRA